MQLMSCGANEFITDARFSKRSRSLLLLKQVRHGGTWKRSADMFHTCQQAVQCSFVPPADATVLSLSPDGRLIGFGDSIGQIHVLDASSGEKISTITSNFLRAINCISFDEAATRVAAGIGSVVQVWRVSGEKISKQNGHGDRVISASASRDGSLLATSGDDGVLVAWNTLDGEEILRQRVGPCFVVLTDDGDRLYAASHSDSGLQRLDIRTGQRNPLLTLRKKAMLLELAAFGKSEFCLAEFPFDGPGQLVVGNTTTTSTMPLDVKPFIRGGLVVSPDGRNALVYSVEDRNGYVYSIEERQFVKSIQFESLRRSQITPDRLQGTVLQVSEAGTGSGHIIDRFTARGERMDRRETKCFECENIRDAKIAICDEQVAYVDEDAQKCILYPNHQNPDEFAIIDLPDGMVQGIEFITPTQLLVKYTNGLLAIARRKPIPSN
jgi:hypothetical protein